MKGKFVEGQIVKVVNGKKTHSTSRITRYIRGEKEIIYLDGPKDASRLMYFDDVGGWRQIDNDPLGQPCYSKSAPVFRVVTTKVRNI